MASLPFESALILARSMRPRDAILLVLAYGPKDKDDLAQLLGYSENRRETFREAWRGLMGDNLICWKDDCLELQNPEIRLDLSINHPENRTKPENRENHPENRKPGNAERDSETRKTVPPPPPLNINYLKEEGEESPKTDWRQTPVGQLLQLYLFSRSAVLLENAERWCRLRSVEWLEAAWKTANSQNQGHKPVDYLIWLLNGERPLDTALLPESPAPKPLEHRWREGDWVLVKGEPQRVMVVGDVWLETFDGDLVQRCKARPYVPGAAVA